MRVDHGSKPAGEAPAATRKAGKNGAENTLRRRLALLTLLPYGDQPGVCARVLTEKLNRERYGCSKRTVERDLDEISGNKAWSDVGIEVERAISPSEPNTYLWRHKGPRKPLLLRLPSGEDALLVALMAQELQPFLPRSASSVLSAYQPASDGVLRLPGHTGHGRYHTKVRSLADGPLMHPPEIDNDHVREINEALLRDEQIMLRYRAASRGVENDYRLHPVGMVKKGLFIWLIAFKEEANRLAEGARTFRLDRVVSARRRHNEPVARKLPDLETVLESGVLAYFPKDLVRLSLRSRPSRAGDELINNYRDTPLSRDQRITELAGGGFLLEAQVRDTHELLWMLQGQAHLLEVLEPPALRHKVQRFVTMAAEHYAPQAEIGARS